MSRGSWALDLGSGSVGLWLLVQIICIPDHLFRPPKDGLPEVNVEDADPFFLTQVLTSDTTDGYKGVPDIGSKKSRSHPQPLASLRTRRKGLHQGWSHEGRSTDASTTCSNTALVRLGWRERGANTVETIRHEEDMRRKAREDKPNMVNRPPHYNTAEIECIDAIMAATGDGFGYHLQGTIMKYLWRYQHKDNLLQDLKKARWHLDQLIDWNDPDTR